MSDHQADYPIATMCQLLGVSSSGYYAWGKRQPSQRSETDAALIAEIQVAHAGSRGTYGAPRIHAELAAKGTHIGRKRVARLMTQAGLAGVSRRRFVTTTVKDGAGRRRTWWSATSRQKRLIGCGSPTSPTFRPGRGFSISPSCSMRIAPGGEDGVAWPTHCRDRAGDQKSAQFRQQLCGTVSRFARRTEGRDLSGRGRAEPKPA